MIEYIPFIDGIAVLFTVNVYYDSLHSTYWFYSVKLIQYRVILNLKKGYFIGVGYVCKRD